MGTVTPLGRTPNGCAPGDVCDWVFLDDDTGEELSFTNGTLLGFASSQRRNHNHPNQTPRTAHPSGGGPACSACRWFEVHIVKHDAIGYVVSYVGRTTLPNETDRHSCHVTLSPHTVIEVLTQHRGDTSFIPRTSRIALSEAAARDPAIEDAWVNRAVT